MKVSILLIICLLFACNQSHDTIDLNEFNKAKDNWAVVAREIQIDQLLLDLNRNLQAKNVLIRNANLITMTSDQVQENQSVYVENGIIQQLGIIDRNTLADNIEIVDANGRYLMPGLVDSHVHVAEGSHVEKLEFISAGVTTVREMCGFDWMLPLRESIRRNELLAPNFYLASTMMNYASLGVYTTVVKTEEEAREMVRKQTAKGYDYIKVWNVMPVNILKAIADECHKLNIDLVGHVPHEATVKDALDIGMRTQEHFKGFILDRSLTLTDEDFVNEINRHVNKSYWLTPTFALYLQDLKNDTAANFYQETHIANYVAKEILEKWIANSKQPRTRRFTASYVRNLMNTVYRKLEKTDVHYIAGTDFNGENDNMVAGYSLIEELRAFESLGMNRFEVLKTATINAAHALGKATEFGTIEIGKRADLILLDRNPLDDLMSFYDDKAVMLRGNWFDKERLKSIMDKVRNIYQSDLTNDLSKPEKLVESIVNHYRQDDVIRFAKPIALQLVARNLNRIGLKKEAESLMSRLLEFHQSYDSYDVLAQIQLAAGDTINAKKSMEQSIQLYPRGDYSAKKLESLN
ncbi:MAG: amidohydrolase family protein [Calditrichaeota bacterium]|nr:amidohydrolase family protein [Calditrichota bacterium]